ncbi:hypothetical protein D3C84_621890 [compost metagenome]
MQAFQGTDEFFPAGIAPRLFHALAEQQHRTVGPDLQHRMFAAELLAFAQLSQGGAPGPRPVAGHERISQEHPPGKPAGHLHQVPRHLVGGSEQIGHLARGLQTRGQAAEPATAAHVEHRARAQRQLVLRRLVGLQAHFLPGVVQQVLGQFLGCQPLARLVRVGDQRRTLQHAQTGGGVVGQGNHLFAQPRQRFENLPAGLGRALQRQRPDQGHAGLFQAWGQFGIQCRHQRCDQGEHLFLFDQLVERMLGADTVGTGIEDGQAQLPAMNPARFVDPRHAAPQHRRHRGALLAQHASARQQGAQVQAVGAQARIALISQALEVGRQVALIAHRQDEPRHRRIQPVVARVTPLLDRTGHSALGVGWVGTSVDLLLAVGAGQPRPAQVRRAHPAFRAPQAIAAVAVGARQAGGRQQHARRPDPGHDRLTAGRYTFAVQPLARAFAGRQR